MSSFTQGYSSVGLIISPEDHQFDKIKENLIKKAQKNMPNHEIEDLYDVSMTLDVFYLDEDNTEGPITVDYATGGYDTFEEVLILNGNYPKIIGGSYATLEDAENDLRKRYSDVLPDDFDYIKHLGFAEYAVDS